MIKYYTSSAYRKHYSNLQKLNLLSESLEIEPYDLGNYILKTQNANTTKSSKSPGKKTKTQKKPIESQLYFQELLADLQVYKNQTLTPIKIFKSLLLIHCCFLLVKNSPNDDNVDQLNSYFRWILQQTVKLIDKFSKKENKKPGNSRIGNSFSKNSQSTTFELFEQTKSTRARSSSMRSTSRPKSLNKYSNDEILSKELCLLSNIVRPYILYLQKLLSIYSHYQNLLHAIPGTFQSSQELSWTVLNIFKLMSPIIQNFHHIGRYFYKQYSPIVYLIIQFFSKQVCRMYPKVIFQAKRKIKVIEHQWFVLLQKYSEYQIFHNEQIQIEGVENAMMLVDQIVKINDSLYHLYLGKYFYQVVQKLKLPEPKWFQIHSKQCQFLLHFNKMKFKNGRRKSTRESSKEKTQVSVNERKSSRPFSDLNIQSAKTKPGSNLPRSQPIHYKIVIEKKNLIPKVKNSLKLGTQKQNKDKQDTITFRLKEINYSMNQSKTIGDESFRNEKQAQKTENIQTLRAKIRNYQILEV